MNESLNNPPSGADRGPETAPTNSLQPRIWLGSLADYNAGRLHGDWLDAAIDDDELLSAAQAVLDASREPGAEEWAIFDFDEFGDFRVEEYADLRAVARVARGIAEHGPAFAAWAELTRSEEPERLDDFADAFLGAYASPTEWAEEVIANLVGDIDAVTSPWLQPYVRIDYEMFARDSTLAGEIELVEHPDGVWVFDVR